MSKTSKRQKSPKEKKVIIEVQKGEDPALKTAQAMIAPYVTNAFAFANYMTGTIGDVELDKLTTALVESAKRVRDGNMKDVEGMLMTQASVLNGMFADLVNRSASNRRGGYFEASQQYLKMACKAQNQCRMTLETLSTIKNPPVVYARQANIAHGPQQVNNGPAAPTRTNETQKAPNELLEKGDEQRLDECTAEATGGSDKALEAVGTIDRAED